LRFFLRPVACPLLAFALGAALTGLLPIPTLFGFVTIWTTGPTGLSGEATGSESSASLGAAVRREISLTTEIC
jgi:hypothetical protein